MGSIIGYIVTAVVTFGLTLVLANWDDISRDSKRKKAEKNKQRLIHGIPKRVVKIESVYQLSKKKNSVLYINGQTFYLSNWFCNDDGANIPFYEKNGDGNIKGWINSVYIRLNPLGSDRKYQEGFVIKYCQQGVETCRYADIKAVREVY